MTDAYKAKLLLTYEHLTLEHIESIEDILNKQEILCNELTQLQIRIDRLLNSYK